MSVPICRSRRILRRGNKAAGEHKSRYAPSPAARFSHPPAYWVSQAQPCRERGQALAEVALFSVLAVLLAFGLLAWIPIHRARTIATVAAYGCAQFLAESPDPGWAAWGAQQVAQQTLDADWSATLGTEYNLEILPPSRPGSSGTCVVFFKPPLFFNGLLDLAEPGWSSEWFVSRSEAWKAKWR